MLVVMQHGATADQVQRVVETIGDMGYQARPMPGAQRTAIGLVGNDGLVDASRLAPPPGAKEVIHLTHPYKQVSREWKAENTVVRLPGGLAVGGDQVVVMAGPCSVEAEEQILASARAVREAGAAILRGGAFKPRSSPYTFQGLGLKGLKLLAKAREETGLLVVTEAMDIEGVAAVEEHAVILCERGVRGFDSNTTRNVFDVSAIAVVHELSHLPIIADPSHATGRRDKVIPMARAAVAAGADGILVEGHPQPARAPADRGQSLYPHQFPNLI